ncbi:MAG: glycerol-3-phosphate dehydrogenase [Psychromonas sp.]|nr:glycerol-3-phosphate dehydrogenase [Alteromonadales bacterium]MCP5078136.1 glycerol-3-phosphate dehydrogenase [Psychromonas sp.]
MNTDKNIIDLLIVGGGINGAGIACDAIGRGLSVALFEAQDFACATSSASSKLLHGGLRYLEYYEFRLVAEALAEREVLLKKAPHIVSPMRFVLPHRAFLRSACLIRLGLFLYDRLSKRNSLSGSEQIDLQGTNVLQKQFVCGFEYSDCVVDDARLVLLNILHAQQLGASVNNYCQVTQAKRVDGLWLVTLFDAQSQQTFQKQARVLVNATGPWVCQFIDQQLKLNSEQQVRLIKGSHIILPRLYNQPQAYILQNEDKRIVFVIPYLNKFSLVGTTDEEYQGDPRLVSISKKESQYLLDVVNGHFIKQTRFDDIVASYSGVRPLYEDKHSSAQAVTRDYKLVLQAQEGEAPLVSIIGGKITTYRKLAESVCRLITPYFPTIKEGGTEKEPLPGGDFSCSREALLDELLTEYPWVDPKVGGRYIRQFGTLSWLLLADKRDLGTYFGADLYQVEVDYLVNHEFVTCLDDLIWRRTKVGLFLSDIEQQALQQYLKKIC